MNSNVDISGHEPILIHVNNAIDMPDNRIMQLDNATLRNELILSHAQIEALHKIIGLLSGCINCVSSEEDYQERYEAVNCAIDDYEETYHMVVEFDL